MELKIQKLHDAAKLPSYAHDTDAGLDLYAVETMSIQAGQRAQIPIGIALAIPQGYVGLIWDKSGLSHKAGLKTLGGVVDAGYRGEIFIGILNTSDAQYVCTAGDKIAQMLIQKVEQPQLVVVDTLEDTTRGVGAFGSTGK